MEQTEKTQEQIASEQQLQGLVDAQEVEPGQEPQPEQININPVESLKGLLQVGAMLLAAVGLKNTSAVWSDQNCEAVASATIPVMQKYAWGQKAIEFLTTGAGVQEMALFAVLMPMSMATVQAYKLDTAKPVETEEPKPGSTDEPAKNK